MNNLLECLYGKSGYKEVDKILLSVWVTQMVKVVSPIYTAWGGRLLE